MPKGLNLASKLMGIVLVLGFLVALFPPGADDGSTNWLKRLGIWFAIFTGTAILAIIEAAVMLKRGDLVALRRATRLVKLCGIPLFSVIAFYALIILVGGIFLGSLMAVGGVIALLSIAMMPFFVAGAWLVMLPTSFYGIACLVQLRRTGAIGWPFFIVNLILHLLLIADVVSTLVVAVRAQHGRVRPLRLVVWLVIAAALTVIQFPAQSAGDAVLDRVEQQRQADVAKMPGVIGIRNRSVVLEPSVTGEQSLAVYRKVGRLSEEPTPWELRSGSVYLSVKKNGTEAAALTLAVLGKVRFPSGEYVGINPVYETSVRADAGSVEVSALTEDLLGDAEPLIRAIAAADPAARRTVDKVHYSGPKSVDWDFEGAAWTQRAGTADLVHELSGLRSHGVGLGAVDLVTAGRTTAHHRSTVELEVHSSGEVTGACRAGDQVLADHPEIELSVSVKGATPKVCA